MTNGPLTALANGGVYAYGSSTTFPTNSFNAVQLLGRRGLRAGPSAHGSDHDHPRELGQTSVPVSTAVSVTFNKAIQAGTAIRSP